MNESTLLGGGDRAKAVPDAFLRDVLAPTLNRFQVALAIDSGAATWMSYRRDTLNVSTEQFLEPRRQLMSRLRSYGVRLDRVTLQSVLSKPLVVDGQMIDCSMEQRIQDVVDYAGFMTSHFQDPRIGIIDALPTKGLEYEGPYAALKDALASRTMELDHIHHTWKFIRR